MYVRAHSYLIAILGVLFSTVVAAQTPGPPSNLTVTPHDDLTVTLQWSPPSTGGAPTGYRIEVGTSSGASNTLVRTLGVTTTHRTSQTFTPGATYYFRVRAFNGAGVSLASNEVALTMPCPAPTVPVHVSWRPVDASGVQVVWVGGGIGVAFTVEFGSAPGLADVLTAAPTPGHNSHSVQATLAPGTYYARVVSRSTCSSATATSAEILVTAGEAYGSPQVLIDGDRCLRRTLTTVHRAEKCRFGPTECRQLEVAERP